MLFKLFFCLGLIYLTVGLLYPGQDAAWNLLGTQISLGPNLPTFNNPYATGAQATFLEVPRASSPPAAIESVNGCTSAEYWQCIQFNTQGQKYLTLNSTDNGLGGGGGGYFTVLMTNVTGVVVSAYMTVWCRSISSIVGTPVARIQIVQPGPTYTGYGPSCTTGVDFAPVRMKIEDQPPNWRFPMNDTVWNSFSDGITLRAGSTDSKVQVTFIQAEIVVDTGGTTGSCGSDIWAFGCQLSRLVDPVIKFFQFIGNGISFVIAFVVTLFAFVGILIGLIFIGLFTTTSFLLTGTG